MNWYRAEINLSGKDYVHYLMSESIYSARVQMIGRYGSKRTAKARIDDVTEKPELKTIEIKLNDLRAFKLHEVVCNDEHAKVLSYEKYGYKNIKEINIL